MTTTLAQCLRTAAAIAALAWIVPLQAADARDRYVVTFVDAPLATFRGSSKALDANGQRLAATAPEVTGADKLDARSARSKAYLGWLAQRQDDTLAQASVRAGRALVPNARLRALASGAVLELSPAEADAIRDTPGVLAVQRDRVFHLLTDAGPAWIGADQVWNGVVPGSTAATRGEGIVIGILDSGINTQHPSFADVGGDGHNHVNPRGRFYGLCVASPARCNDKLIGIYEFTDEGARDGSDLDGHGSHVAGTAAGNAIASTLSGTGWSIPLQLAGVAPHANLISYKVCKEGSAAGSSICPFSAIISALDQAAIDGVDVVNASLGGEAYDPWTNVRDGGVDLHEAFLNARAAGVVPVTAAGNDGPGPRTIGSPAVAPWVLAVANSTHDRAFPNTLTDVTGTGIATPQSFAGVALTGAAPERRIVHAKDYGNALCGTGTSQGGTPTGASNPFAAGTFNGEIVICDRGTYARVEKSYNVQRAGAGGFVLANSAAEGESVVADAHVLPSVHLGYARGLALRTLVEGARLANGQVRGSISGVQRAIDAARADVVSSSSSRGPVALYGGWGKPNLSAPGSDILAAAKSGSALASLSGTSMSSPHVAGAAALVLAVHPDWSVAKVESALLTTGLATLRKQDGTTPADGNDVGIGRAYLPAAVRAALYFDTTRADFAAADPLQGGTPSALNLPSLTQPACLRQCTFTRTVSDMGGGGNWRVEPRVEAGMLVTALPSTFTLAPGSSQVLQITVDVSDPRLAGAWAYGELALVSTSSATMPDTRLPIAVFSDPGVTPSQFLTTASTDAGYVDVDFPGGAALANPVFRTSGLVPIQFTTRTMARDTTADPYDNVEGAGVFFVLLPPPALSVTPGAPPVFPATSPVHTYAETTSASARDLNVFVGVDSNNNGLPERTEQRCEGTGNGAAVRCLATLQLPLASAAPAWVLVQSALASGSGSDSVTLRTAIAYDPSVPLPLEVTPSVPSVGRLVATGPGRVAAQAPYQVRLAWNAPGIALGETYVGFFSMLASPESKASFGLAPVFATLTGTAQRKAQVLRADAGSLQLKLAPGEAHERIVVDIPANASSVVVTLDGTGEGDLYMARAPGGITPPDVPAAPPRGAAQATSIHPGATERIDLTGATLTPGRWYITPVNAGAGTASLRLTVSSTLGTPPTLRDNGYFNPARPGHGVFLSEGGDQLLLIWYSYLQDGTPMWYLAQNTRPAANETVWRAPLYRFTWNGTRNNGTIVGDVYVTRTGTDEFVYSWLLDGTWGSELLQRVAAPSCSPGASPTDYSGSWFAPQSPGYGFSVLTFATTEVEVAYLYDAAGNPRWLYGQELPLQSTPFALTQYRGFCPTCAYAPIVGQVAGSLSRTFGSPGAGNANVQGTFLAPFSGSWSTNQATAKITRDLACPSQ